MKFKTAFHLLVATMIAFGVTSCGSDKNSTDTGSVTSVVANPVTTGTGNGASTRQEFYNEVNSGLFEQASSSGLYSFPRNVTSGGGFDFDFDFCWGDECFEQQMNGYQYQVDNYYWRYLDTDGQTIIRNFTANGLRYSAPDSDSLFGSTLTSLKSGLLNIIQNATSVDKAVQSYYGYSWESVGVAISAYNNGSTIDISDRFNNGFNSGYTNSATYSKIFKFKYNSYWYVIDLTSPLIANPVAVYPN